MRFRVKDLNISGGKHLVAVMNEDVACIEGVHVSSRVKLINGRKNLTVVVDLADRDVLDRNEIGLFNEVMDKLGVKDGDEIEVKVTSQPLSVQYIKKKLDGLELKKNEINEIIKDVVNNRLSEVEMSAFVTACYTRNLTMDETYHLTRSVVNNGKKIKFNDKIILDKHCIGGISGNRTTMLIVPIIAALGLKIPKTSSRSITSPSGTADTMEVLAPVTLTTRKIKSVVNKCGGCIAWGGAINLAAADDKLISVRHPLALDPLGLMLASIMAKKHSVSSNHVLIDIPLGFGAKTKTIGEAKYLARQFTELGERLGMKVKVVITEGNYPIGRGIGPVLEARDVLWVLKNDPRGPADLRNKALYLAGELIELAGKSRVGGGLAVAKEVLDDGRALRKFKEIIKLQGGKWVEPDELKPAPHKAVIKASKSGVIVDISDDIVSKVARLAGAPIDKGAGIYLNKVVGDLVKKGEPVLTIYSESERLLSEALKESRGIYSIGKL